MYFLVFLKMGLNTSGVFTEITVKPNIFVLVLDVLLESPPAIMSINLVITKITL